MDEIDRILGDEPLIAASSDFSARVMQSVRQQAAVPPPLEFPWRRMLPGLVTCVALSLGTFMVLGWAGEAGVETFSFAALRDLLLSPVAIGLATAAIALAGSAVLAWVVLRPGKSPTSY